MDGRDDRRAQEAIAIIGMGCRFPGAAGLAEFWALLRDGIEAVAEMPPGRFDIDALHDPRPGTPGRIVSRRGGFLPAVERFDAAFFGISPREATVMDPQQRFLLEVAWEALEDAGVPPDRLAGSRAGVFVGLWTSEYEERVFRSRPDVDLYMTTGTGRYAAAGRLSYAFDLRGPSLTVDTACSSSLVAVHLACQSLRRGESTLALVGGANLILAPHISLGYSRSRMLSPEGRCKFGDVTADGYVRSEGVGVVVLKLLSRARADGDRIHAVVRGSATNNDGSASGLLVAPSPATQEAMLRAAYLDAGVALDAVQYVEAHGTGTGVGDPVEMAALGAVLGAGRAPDRPCLVGSVKTNIGHTEAASGIAGLIKLALCLERRTIPASLHLREPNPRIPWKGLGLAVPRAAVPWPEVGGRPLGGVNSFGITGTNAHVVLEAAPDGAEPRAGASRDETYLLPVSARDANALRDAARAYRRFLSETECRPALADICYTAAVRRGHHEHRIAVVGRSPGELAARLDAVLAGGPDAGAAIGRAEPGRRRVVFVFSGQGSQWSGMGRELLAREPIFRESLERCDTALRAHVSWSVVAELTSDTGARLADVDVVQPALFAVQVALAALWQARGVRPEAVVGHSMGEVAAAHVAGALSLEDAARIVCARSRLLRRLAGRGAMALVELPLEAARAAVAGRDDVAVAASNGPRATVLSGEPAALEAVLTALAARGIFTRLVNVNVASHSPQVDALQADLLAALADLRPAPPAIALYSTVTGAPLTSAPHPEYWAHNLRQPVLLDPAVRSLVRDGHDLFVEVSPHPILVPAIGDTLRDLGRDLGRDGGADAAVVPSFRRDEDPHAALLGSLGTVWALGASVDWSALYPAGGRCVALPPYPWQRERFWVADPGPAHEAGTDRVRASGAAHPLLGRPLDVAHGRVWEAELGGRSRSHADAHTIRGVPVLSAAGYVEMARAAAREVRGPGTFAVRDLELHRALFLDTDHPRRVQLAMDDDGDRCAFRIHAAGAGGWLLHAAGAVEAAPAVMDEPAVPLAAVRARCPAAIEGDAFYAMLAARGVGIGPDLCVIDRLWRGPAEAIADLRLSPDAASSPAWLEAALQLATAVLPDGGDLWMPVALDDLRGPTPSATPSHGYVARRAEEPDPASAMAVVDVRLLDAGGRPVAALAGVRLRRAGDATGPVSEAAGARLYEVAWQPDRPAADPGPSALDGAGGRWLILADRAGVGAALARALGERGEPASLLGSGSTATQLTDAVRRGVPWRGILHLWGLDAPEPGVLSPATLEDAETSTCGVVLTLVQTLTALASTAPPRVWLVTRGAQPVASPGAAVAVAQAPLWGLGRVLAREHPELWGGLLDLDPDVPVARAAAELCEALRYPGGEPRAIRDGVWRVPRLVAGPRPAARVRLTGDATYLIAGGHGDVGRAVAAWMVARGAIHLVLVGRRALPSRGEWEAVDPESAVGRRVAAIRALEASGARVSSWSLDLADEVGLRAALEDRRRDRLPPVRGVVHAAAVVEDRLLAALEPATLHAVLRPKVTGAWTLHRVFAERALDFFVCFSSIGALLGPVGQGAYAAANTFLDALALHRRARGLPGLSIAWGPWAGLGLATTTGGGHFAAELARHGLAPVSPAAALDALERLLSSDAAHAVVVGGRAGGSDRGAGLALTMGLTAAGDHRDTRAAAGSVRETLAAAEPARRLAALEQHVREQVGGVLRLEPERVDGRQPFRALGLESLMALELRAALEASLGLRLSATVVWNYPTPAALAAYLAERLAGDPPAGNGGVDGAVAPAAPAPLPAPADELDNRLDGELAAELERVDDLLRRTRRV